ncbi:MAG: histidine kinase [Pseudomonadota bacterium]
MRHHLTPPSRSALGAWLIRPNKDWRHKTARRVALPLLALLGVIGLPVATALVLNLWMLATPGSDGGAAQLQLAVLVIGLLATLALPLLAYRHLVTPLFHLRHWAQRVRGGNLAARIPTPQRGEFADLARDVNRLTEQLERLTRDMREEVHTQTERLEQKSRTLEILYDVASSINTSRDLDDLLTRFLARTKDTLGAQAATARLVTPDGQMRLVANLGFQANHQRCQPLLPLGQCLCGHVADGGDLGQKDDVSFCGQAEASSGSADEPLSMMAVPLQHQGRTLGVYSLFFQQCPDTLSDDMRGLLNSIGQHLGMAIEKSRLDEQARRVDIMEERARMSHELHDSLAQTLASLRFRVGALNESLPDDSPAELRNEANTLWSSLAQANQELRELIRHFRAPPVSHQGLDIDIDQLITRFREETGVSAFMQKEWNPQRLPEEMETEVLRIVQEALCNIRKHADAQHVRVLLRNEPRNQFLVLVEDDGCGAELEPTATDEGDHIGLSVMEKRAERLGADIRIESEPGEGTRISLSFRHPQPQVVQFEPRKAAP